MNLADEYHLAMWRAYATTFEGWMIGARGDPMQGIARTTLVVGGPTSDQRHADNVDVHVTGRGCTRNRRVLMARAVGS